jgi:hypothetical protein
MIPPIVSVGVSTMLWAGRCVGGSNECCRVAANYSMAPQEQRRVGMVAFAGSIGTIIEWYDFLIYGTAAALVFNKSFFPNIDPRIGTLASLGTFAVGFLARPIVGLILVISVIGWAANPCSC